MLRRPSPTPPCPNPPGCRGTSPQMRALGPTRKAAAGAGRRCRTARSKTCSADLRRGREMGRQPGHGSWTGLPYMQAAAGTEEQNSRQGASKGLDKRGCFLSTPGPPAPECAPRSPRPPAWKGRLPSPRSRFVSRFPKDAALCMSRLVSMPAPSAMTFSEAADARVMSWMYRKGRRYLHRRAGWHQGRLLCLGLWQNEILK